MSAGRPVVLTIGALHGGAEEGIVADAAVIAELDARARCVATCVTGPDGDLEPLPASLVASQLERALDAGPRAVRVGTIASEHAEAAIASALAARAPAWLVVSPEAGAPASLLPLASVLVSRAREVRDLPALRAAAAALRQGGARAVLLAGASIRGRVVDLLDDGGRVSVFDAPRLQAPRVAGLAGAHASALATHLARGAGLEEAALGAQRYVGLRLRRGR